MKRIALIYGGIAGTVIILTMMIGMSVASNNETQFSELLGYLVMVAAMSLIFIGIKKYRDHSLGGVIKFGTAFLLGLGITVVASIIYVAVWEVNLAVTDHAFINEYTDSIIAQREAGGASAEEITTLVAEMEELKADYAKPFFRIPMTFLELFPVGLLISLISAAVLKNRKVLPAEQV